MQYCFHMILLLRLVALYEKVVLYGAEIFLAHTDRNGLAATLGHLALWGATGGENLSLSEPPKGVPKYQTYMKTLLHDALVREARERQ